MERSEAHSRARRRSCQNTLLATPCIASTEARKSRLFPESLLNLHDNKVSHAYWQFCHASWNGIKLLVLVENVTAMCFWRNRSIAG